MILGVSCEPRVGVGLCGRDPSFWSFMNHEVRARVDFNDVNDVNFAGASISLRDIQWWVNPHTRGVCG
jgi:hypothetical protein